jgi:hypothetical protein
LTIHGGNRSKGVCNFIESMIGDSARILLLRVLMRFLIVPIRVLAVILRGIRVFSGLFLVSFVKVECRLEVVMSRCGVVRGSVVVMLACWMFLLF